MANIEYTYEIVPRDMMNDLGEVQELTIGRGGSHFVAESELPVKFLVAVEYHWELDKAPAIPDANVISESVVKQATPVAKLTKQTGTHSITTSNGFTGTGTIDELADNLRNFGIELSVQDDVMIFTNTLEQEISISIQAQGRSGKNYVAIEQENTHIDLVGKNAEFKLTAVIVATNDVIPSVARLSHGNNLYNLRVSNGYSTKPRFSISTSDFVKAGIHAYIENGQLVLSNRTPEEITVNLSTYDAEFIAIEQDNKTVQINAKSVNLTLGAYRGVDFNNQRAKALPLLTDIIIPSGRYAVSYRVNDGEVKTIVNFANQTNAQNILANVLYYEGLMSEKLVSNGAYSSNDEESRMRPFLVNYQKSLQGADFNHPKFIRNAHFKIEFVLTNAEEHDFVNDFVKLAFGKNTAIHSYAIVNWINTPVVSASSSIPEPDGRPVPEPDLGEPNVIIIGD